MAASASTHISPLVLRQDLLVELGRLDSAIKTVQSGRPSERAQRLWPLETERARTIAALRGVPR
jgi:hypothetical protein